MSSIEEMYGSPEGWSGISASAAGATIECPARLALPQARATSDAAERGNELHAFARIVTVNPSGRDQALLDVPEKWRHTAAGMDIALALEGLQVVGCERAYALNVNDRTVRFIGENIDRGYNEELKRQGQPLLGRYEIPFTIDVEAFHGATPVELDYKSGQSIGDPSEHWQRRICATGLMIYHDTPTAISRVAYIWDDGTIHPDGTEFSILDAEDYCDILVKAIDAVWEARRLFSNRIMPTVYPSDTACKYCPAVMSCPYQTNIAKSMLGKLQAIENGPELSALTPEELGQVWEMAKTAESIVTPLLKNLKGIADTTPLPVGPGHEVRWQTKSRKYFNDAAARGMIVTLLGRLGHSDEEISSQMKKLEGKTEYREYRKLKVVA